MLTLELGTVVAFTIKPRAACGYSSQGFNGEEEHRAFESCPFLCLKFWSFGFFSYKVGIVIAPNSQS